MSAEVYLMVGLAGAAYLCFFGIQSPRRPVGAGGEAPGQGAGEAAGGGGGRGDRATGAATDRPARGAPA
ncbi:hypothetical protein [Streptomyces sp. NPDC058623]|uniref:hypothetical protein n=1 Tax=Streptomyces sp. NPDC058623 TaxID=3346563 RepID=UPI0036682114